MAKQFVDRVSSLDPGYQTGDLSVFPAAQDDADRLFKVANNAETVLSQGLSYTSRYVMVADTSAFPDSGLVRVGDEIVYYATKLANRFEGLKRGYAGSRQNFWPAGTAVTNSVMADSHNAVKDAILNIEADLGTELEPAAGSLNGILKGLENRFLAPKPTFRANPKRGRPALKVTFQNFSGGDAVRFLWDFGDGGQSSDESPTYTYHSEGVYTVTLNMITSLGAQAICTKTDYVEVNDELQDAFFYVTPAAGTAGSTFSFVDQSIGDIATRIWLFGDGERATQDNPDIHDQTHVYATAGTYNPTLILVFADQTTRFITIPDSVVVT